MLHCTHHQLIIHRENSMSPGPELSLQPNFPSQVLWLVLLAFFFTKDLDCLPTSLLSSCDYYL